jgi:asparagine synthase (glutamine-hydrolysing)
MHSASGRFVVAFNGEIYNHLELRAELEDIAGTHWRGHSDTETLLAGFDAWGIEATLRRAVGMFAFAVVDRQLRELTLARDRLGEKPLYYGWQGDAFLFGSELKALKPHPKWQGKLDTEALTSYMHLSYVPSPMAIFEGIHKLPAACMTSIKLNGQIGQPPSVKPYWSALDYRNNPELKDISSSAAEQELKIRLERSIAGQLQADVPVGAFLSGGIDSSLVVAMMQAQSTSKVKTFSIGFDDPRLDEAPFARAIASHLGTDHSELYVSADDVIDTIPAMVDIYDEPLADSSQIPTYLVSKLAVQDVTVSLSGDGGDELFGGYNRYRWGESIWNKIKYLPAPLRTLLARTLTTIPASQWDKAIGLFKSNANSKAGDTASNPAYGDKLHKLAMMIDVKDRDGLYEKLISQQRESASLVCQASKTGSGSQITSWDQSLVQASNQHSPIHTFAEHAMLRDLLGYMSDDILAKLDRAAMAVSLETRAPLLDHRVVEFAVGLPLHHKLHQGQTKQLLRQLLYRYVPKEMVERPKQGFSVPLDAWLKGRLKDWAYDHIAPSKIRADGLLNAELIERRWQQHQSGEHNWQHWLWNVVMFQVWKEKWL